MKCVHFSKNHFSKLVPKPWSIKSFKIRFSKHFLITILTD